jgi:L-lactate dehydrogenase complex protein LldG
MSSPVPSRSLILDRIRAATVRPASEARLNPPRTYTRHGSLDVPARVKLMIERLREYDAEVLECTPEHLVPAIADQLRTSSRHKFAAPAGLPVDWLVPGYDWQIDIGLPASEIEHCEGVVTAATIGVADSGTIVLHHSASEGRRVISLLPDWHLCVLRVSQIVETFPEYIDTCTAPPKLATYISGPSATADIEMTRIKGVHGPRFLHVIVVHDEMKFDTAHVKAGNP